MIALVLAVLIVLLSSAFCSGSEAALFSIGIIKVRQLAQTRPKAGKALMDIRTNMSRPIAAIVVLNNIANIVGSIIIGAIAAEVFGSEWLGAFSAVLTFLVIIFSEIIPKTVGEQHAEKISLAVAGPILLISKIMGPILWIIEKITAPLTGKKPFKSTTNETEIKLLAQIGGQEGVIDPQESDLIPRVFELNNTTAKMLMTPRVSMTYLFGKMSLEEAKTDVIASQHSRLVVIGDTRDEVLGVVLKDELLIAMLDGKGEEKVAAFANPPQLIEEDTTAEALLSIFQQTKQLLGVVVGEYGGVSGVVTLEDVVEILLGEIVDETDQVVDMQEYARKQAAKNEASKP